MSKVSEHVNAYVTNHRVPNDGITDVSFTVKQDDYSFYYRVRLSLALATEILVDEKHAFKDSEMVQVALKDAKQRIIEEIFGEFRIPLMKIRESLYNRNITKAQDQLRDIEKQMFNV